MRELRVDETRGENRAGGGCARRALDYRVLPPPRHRRRGWTGGCRSPGRATPACAAGLVDRDARGRIHPTISIKTDLPAPQSSERRVILVLRDSGFGGADFSTKPRKRGC